MAGQRAGRAPRAGSADMFGYMERWAELSTGAWKKQIDIWRGAHARVKTGRYGTNDWMNDALHAWEEWLCSAQEMCSHVLDHGSLTNQGCGVETLSFVVDFAAETTDPCTVDVDPTIDPASVHTTPLVGFDLESGSATPALVPPEHLQACIVAPGQLEIRLVDLRALRGVIGSGKYSAAVYGAVPGQSTPLALVDVFFQPA